MYRPVTISNIGTKVTYRMTNARSEKASASNFMKTQ
jgi:hypothetical protein